MLLLAEDMSDGTLDEETFQQRASRFVTDHPGLINVTWADEEFIIRWTAPYEPNKQVVGLKLTLPEPERASHEARDTGRPVYTRPFEVIQGDLAFEVYVPVFRDGRFLGTFGGGYSIEKVLRHLIPRTVGDARHVAFAGESGVVISELPRAGELDSSAVHRVAMDPPGYGAALVVSSYATGIHWGFVILAFLCVALTVGMLWGMWSLKRELALRTRAEQEVRRHRDNLETLVEEPRLRRYATSPTAGVWRSNCASRRRWTPSGGSPEGSRTTSTTSSRASWVLRTYWWTCWRTSSTEPTQRRSLGLPSDPPSSSSNCSPSRARAGTCPCPWTYTA